MRALVAARALALVALAAALTGCAGNEAARRVRIVGARPTCPVVDAKLSGHGADATAAMRDLRHRAARGGVTDVVVTDGPRSEGDGMTVNAIGYGCTGPTAQ